MSPRYRITAQGRPPEPTEAEIARYRDPKRLLYNYHRARRRWHRRPLYKDPRSFLVLLIIVLIAWLLSEAAEKRTAPLPPATGTEAPSHP